MVKPWMYCSRTTHSQLAKMVPYYGWGTDEVAMDHFEARAFTH
jgi:hypothetical protein